MFSEVGVDVEKPKMKFKDINTEGKKNRIFVDELYNYLKDNNINGNPALGYWY